jgi:hypothetical protein
MPRPGTCLVIVALVAVPLYAPLFIPIPTVQGEFYAAGLQPNRIITAISAALVVLFVTRRLDPRWTTLVALALLAYAGRLMESDNLWDYLVDPGLMLAMAFLGFTGICTSLHRRLKGI